MKLTLGFSPCPNDTFIFEAMVHNRVDTEGLEFDYFIADLEELNRRAANGEADITKISCAAYPFVAPNYLILDSGSAIGFRNGPLIVAMKKFTMDQIAGLKIAIPGHFSTANMLLSMVAPHAKNRVEYLFSDIEDAVIGEKVDAGVLIHETRFTYQNKGISLIADLGEVWGEKTGLPLPLGIICAKRDIPEDIALKVNRIINRSLEQAYMDSTPTYYFVKKNARELDLNAISSHIKLFVNDYTLDLGPEGKDAIRRLLAFGNDCGLLPSIPERIFLT